MKTLIALDKYSVNAERPSDSEYIYLFNDESLDELLETNLHCVYYKNCEYADINTTDYDIDCIKKCKTTDEDWYKLPEKVEYKIGIIIPNYNYEHTIEKCLNSVFNQTYKNYEIIFVDDMSTDNSIDIAQTTYLKYCAKELKGQESEWAELPKNFKLVRLKQKRYNGGARNEGYLYLSDDVDYVYYLDSDDWLYDKNSLEEINNRLQSKPDVLFVGIADYKKGETKVCDIPEYKDRYEAIQGWSGSCGKVIKKSLATSQECLYNEGTLKEDRNQHCRICIYMKDFALLKKPVYVWNKENYKSVTTIRTKNIQWETSTIRHYADTLELAMSVKGRDSKIDRYLEKRVKDTRKEMLSGGDKQW